jgi:serine/threonine protein kinase
MSPLPPRAGAREFAPVPFHEGRFLLLEEIGRGGAGAVYRARDNGFEVPRAVCIKRLTHPLEQGVARALRAEARLLLSVRHSNVVTLLGVGEEAGEPFLVLELIDGPNLKELVRALASLDATADPDAPSRGLLPAPLAVHLICAVLRGLGALSRALPGFVHRDITPQNVLVSSEGEIKLTDFGIAFAKGQPRADDACVKGKAGYMAPEQIRGESLDPRTDLYALGVVLYELLAGRRPAQSARGLVEELRGVERGDIEPLATHRPRLSGDLLRVIACLLATTPKDRFPSADAAQRALAPHGAGEMGPLRMASLVAAARRAQLHPSTHPPPLVDDGVGVSIASHEP